MPIAFVALVVPCKRNSPFDKRSNVEIEKFSDALSNADKIPSTGFSGVVGDLKIYNFPFESSITKSVNVHPYRQQSAFFNPLSDYISFFFNHFNMRIVEL